MATKRKSASTAGTGSQGTRRRGPKRTRRQATPLEHGELAVSDLETMFADYNPRRMPEDEMASLRASLAEWGCVEPVIVNRRTGLIVGGHQRVSAAALEGIETLPVVFVNLAPGRERALNLALNRIEGEWDDEKLATVISALIEDGEPTASTGFSEADIARILADGTDAEDAAGETGPGIGDRATKTCPNCGAAL